MSDDADNRAPANNPTGPKVDTRLLEILVCPVTRAELTYDPVRRELVSRAARLAYPLQENYFLCRIRSPGRCMEVVPRNAPLYTTSR